MIIISFYFFSLLIIDWMLLVVVLLDFYNACSLKQQSGGKHANHYTTDVVCKCTSLEWHYVLSL